MAHGWENVSRERNMLGPERRDGLVIRSRAVKAVPEETTLGDLDAIKGSPWARSGFCEVCCLVFHVRY